MSQKRNPNPPDNPESLQHYKQLYQTSKTTITGLQARISKLQAQIRQRCQSYLLHSSGLRSTNNFGSANSSGLKKTSSGSSDIKKEKSLKIAKKVVDQTILAVIGLEGQSLYFKAEILSPLTLKDQTEPPKSQSSINFDSDRRAVESMKERLGQIRKEKNEIFKELLSMKEDNKKLNEEVSKLKQSMSEQERQLRKTNDNLQTLKKYEQAFKTFQKEIIVHELDLGKAAENAEGPMQKMSIYMEKLRNLVSRDRSLFNYSDTIQQDPLTPQAQEEPAQKKLFSGLSGLPRSNTNIYLASESPRQQRSLNNSDNYSNQILRSKEKRDHQASQQDKQLSILQLSKIPSLEAVKMESVNHFEEQVAQQRKIYEKQLNDLKAQIKKLQNQTQRLKENLKESQENQANLKKNIEEDGQEMKLLKKQVENKKTLEKENSELNEKFEKETKELQKSLLKNAQLQNKLRELEGKSTEMESRLQNSEKKNTEKEIFDSQKKSKQVAENVQNTPQSQKRPDSTAGQSESKLNQELRLLKRSQERLQTKNANLLKELNDLRSEMKTLEDKSARLQQESENLKEQVKNLKESHQKANQGSFSQNSQREKIEVSQFDPTPLKKDSSTHSSVVNYNLNANYEEIVAQNADLEKEIKELRDRLANQESGSYQNSAAYNPDFEPYVIEEDMDDGVNGDPYVKRRFIRKKVIRRNLSAMSFRSLSRNKQETVEDLKGKLKKLRQRNEDKEKGNSPNNKVDEAKVKRYVNKIAKLEKLLSAEQDKISELSKESSERMNSRQSDSSMDLDERVDLIEMTTEMPGKSVYAGKIFESKNSQKGDGERQNRFNFAKKGKTESSGVL